MRGLSDQKKTLGRRGAGERGQFHLVLARLGTPPEKPVTA
jgi:hypothetical protein